MESRPYTQLRKDLRDILDKPAWPPGASPSPFRSAQHSKQAHDLVVEAYRPREAHIGSFDAWWWSVREDPEYHPSVFFLALDEDGRVIGLAQCWTSAFLKDLVVSAPWRRKGIGRALLLQAFNTFQERGAVHFDLKVEVGNTSNAEQLYRRAGMAPIA